MKKTAIASVALAAALFAVSCQKETNPVQNESGPMTISAVAEGLNSPTKTELAFKYDVLWSTSDKIYIKDASGNYDTFQLETGAGTTKGTFTQEGQVSFTGEVQAYYPATMLESGSPLWPASQTNDQTIPMYCKKTLSGTTDERMDFASLCSVLQIVFNTTQADITLKSIEIKDGSKTMSGAFSVNDNGIAIITATDNAGITLDLGAGVTVGLAAKYFNIAVPAGDYEDLTLIFTATDGKKCTLTDGHVNIAHNTVGRLTLTGMEFKATGPEYVTMKMGTGSSAYTRKWATMNLGATTVADSYTTCYGELYQWGSVNKLYTNFPWTSATKGSFSWVTGKSSGFVSDNREYTATDAETLPDANDVVKHTYPGTGWRMPTSQEFKDLYDACVGTGGYDKTTYAKASCGESETPTSKGVYWCYNYDGVAGCLFYDGASKLFFPDAGYGEGTSLSNAYSDGYYWSSSLYTDFTLFAYGVYFGSTSISPQYHYSRSCGFSVRPVSD